MLALTTTLRFRRAHRNKREIWTCEQQVDTKDFWWRPLYGLWSFHGERIKDLASFVCIVKKCVTMKTTFFFRKVFRWQWRFDEKKTFAMCECLYFASKVNVIFSNLWMFVAIIFCFCNVFKVRKGSTIVFSKLSEVNLVRVATKKKYFWGSKFILWKFELIAFCMKQYPISLNLQIHSIWDEIEA